MAGLVYTDRRIIEEARSQAGLQARVNGRWGAPDQRFDDHQVAERANDVLLEVWQEIAIRNADALPLVTDRFDWPADTSAIALVPPALGIGHPSLSETPAFFRAIYDESGGTENPPEITITSEEAVRMGVLGGSSVRASRGYVLCAVVRANRLELHPEHPTTFPMRVEYVAVPRAIDAEHSTDYRALPVELLRVAVSRLAADLSLLAESRAKALPVIAARQGTTAMRFKQRLDRAGPRFTNHLWTAYRAA